MDLCNNIEFLQIEFGPTCYNFFRFKNISLGNISVAYGKAPNIPIGVFGIKNYYFY